MGKNEVAIRRERQRENMVAHYKQIGDANSKLMNRIQWEHQTQQSVQKSEIGRLTESLESRREANLEERRRRLRELLRSDDAQLKQELGALSETPHERRTRLQERAAQLRQEKERKRAEYVEEQLRRQFRATTDELRLAGDQKLMRSCEKDRRQQMERKALAKTNEDLQKAKWEGIWEIGRQKQIERERKEAETRKRMDALTYDEIGKQLELIKAERDKHKAVQAQEAEELARIAADEERKEKRRLKLYAERAAAQRLEIQRYNSAVQAKKADEALRKATEGAEVSSLPALMRETDTNLLSRKQELVDDMRRFLAYRQSQQHEARDRDHELEALRGAELERLARRQDLVWQKEQLAREKLMKEVVETRQMQLLEKAEMHRRERDLANIEGSACILKEATDPPETVAARRAALTESLKRQIDERHYQAELDKAARHYETLEAQIAEQEYQRRVRAELAADQADCK